MSNAELIKAERCAVHLDKIPRLAASAKEELRKRGVNNAFLAIVAEIEKEARHIREYIENDEKDDEGKKGQ